MQLVSRHRDALDQAIRVAAEARAEGVREGLERAAVDCQVRARVYGHDEAEACARSIRAIAAEAIK